MLAVIDIVQGALTDSAALASVALIGYLFGRRTRTSATPSPEFTQAVDRARNIAVELQHLAGRIRRDLALHQCSVTRFQSDLRAVRVGDSKDKWQDLEHRAESLLGPTMELSANLSNAYEQLRKQTHELLAYTGTRTDPATGVYTRRAMEEQLSILLSQSVQSKGRFALALLSLASDSKQTDDNVNPDDLNEFAHLLSSCARDGDFVARYSKDEFAVIMPQTSLSGATVFTSRLVQRAETEHHCLVWAGVVEKISGDTAHCLLSRADSALYSARTHGESCLFQHTGESIRCFNGAAPAPAAGSGATSPTAGPDPDANAWPVATQGPAPLEA